MRACCGRDAQPLPFDRLHAGSADSAPRKVSAGNRGSSLWLRPTAMGKAIAELHKRTTSPGRFLDRVRAVGGVGFRGVGGVCNTWPNRGWNEGSGSRARRRPLRR